MAGDIVNTPPPIILKNFKNQKTQMPRIGDKISFEIQDELFEKGLKTVRAQIIRTYPRQRGNCCQYLAYDCIDLDYPDLTYTIAADEHFISVND